MGGPRFEVAYGDTYKEAVNAASVFVHYDRYQWLVQKYPFVIVVDDDENSAAFEEAKQEWEDRENAKKEK